MAEESDIPNQSVKLIWHHSMLKLILIILQNNIPVMYKIKNSYEFKNSRDNSEENVIKNMSIINE